MTAPDVARGQQSPEPDMMDFRTIGRTLEKRLELGLLAGGAQYYGDMGANGFFSIRRFQPAGGAYLRRQLGPFLSARAHVFGGSLSDGDRNHSTPEWRTARDFSFESTYSELGLQAEWQILGKRRFRRADTIHYELGRLRQINIVNRLSGIPTPYLMAGASLVAVSARPDFSGEFAQKPVMIPRVAADREASAGWKSYPSFHFGGGALMDLGRRWVVGLELGYRFVQSDYLDGVSMSGNTRAPDGYWFGALSVGFRLGDLDRDGDGVIGKKDRCNKTPGLAQHSGCPDIDGDGISDLSDECPTVKGVPELAGCPLKDADNDGVADVDDECPDIPGLPQFAGCPDTDGDGIEDRYDECPDLPGIALFLGCPDTDGDGVEDAYDACPSVLGPPGFWCGCPPTDTDGDGWLDDEDLCPWVWGVHEFRGCPDTDCDGIEDAFDLCPYLPGPAENRGCPVIEKKDLDKLKFAVKAVQFETGKAILKKDSEAILNDIADIMRRYPAYELFIDGHTDNVGKPEKNQILSEARARNCALYLADQGIDAGRINFAGYGQTQPVADNKTAKGKALNRRVEFRLELPRTE
ncbi:MAG: OmpA family protein [Saprospiraceae bacterium]